VSNEEVNPFAEAPIEVNPFGEIRPPVEVRGTTDYGGPLGLREPRELPPTRKQELEARDFDIDAEGGSVSARLAAKFGDINDIRASLAKDSGFKPEDFEVANVEKLGVVFKGPGDEKYRVLDPVGLDVGDIVASG